MRIELISKDNTLLTRDNWHPNPNRSTFLHESYKHFGLKKELRNDKVGSYYLNTRNIYNF